MPLASANSELVSTKLHFFDKTPEEFDKFVTNNLGMSKFRGQQIREWVYQQLVTDPQQMSNLSKLDRQRLSDAVSFFTAETTVHQSSNDGTEKLLLSWAKPDASGVSANAETVMIPDGDRRTACISSQVGCPAGCKFCASGMNGVKGNLSAGQIVEQVYALNVMLNREGKHEEQWHEGTKAQRHEGEISDVASSSPPCLRASVPSCLSRITNVVFMGMGEPLANYANVMKAIRILHDPKCLNIGGRKITVSTVGVPAKMRQLAQEELPLNLAISLHAPNESLRRELIPWAEHFSIDEILKAARFYFSQTGREITLEYILLSGVNDRPEHARQLAQVCKTLRANVNLIRYNEVEALPYKRPKAEDVVEFQEILRRAGVNVHVRKSRGRDIDAACGQLRRREQQRQGQQLVTLGAGNSTPE